MFRQIRQEVEELNRSQSVTGSQKHRDPSYPPYAFTEHGAVMLATVPKSPTAIQASVQVVRAFVRLRAFLASHKHLAEQLAALERKVGQHGVLIATILEKLLESPPPKRRPMISRFVLRIGFRAHDQA